MEELLAAYNPYSPAIPVVLLAMLAASGLVFWVLVQRWTRERRWANLYDWAEANGFVVHRGERAIRPEALSLLADPDLSVLVSLDDPDTAIIQVETQRVPGQAGKRPARWNILFRSLETTWPLVGLRPATRPTSILDFLSLSSLTAMSPGERFVLYAAERRAGTIINRSAVRTLLPADIGLVLSGHYMLLDFSSRPFDPLELERLDALAEQLVSRLSPLSPLH